MERDEVREMCGVSEEGEERECVQERKCVKQHPKRGAKECHEGRNMCKRERMKATG